MLRTGRLVVGQYERWLTHRPFLTKSLSAGFLMGSSDYVAQRLEARHVEFHCDHARVARMVAIGCCSGGMMHFWYGFLNRKIVSAGSTGAVAKVAADQLLFSPMAIAGFFVATGIFAGLSVEGIKQSFRDRYLDVLTVNYFIWPISMLINFRYVPPQYQALWASTISVGWSVYLSSRVNKGIPAVSFELYPSGTPSH